MLSEGGKDSQRAFHGTGEFGERGRKHVGPSLMDSDRFYLVANILDVITGAEGDGRGGQSRPMLGSKKTWTTSKHARPSYGQEKG